MQNRPIPSTSEEIRRLIEMADTPSARATLMVLMSIDQAMVDQAEGMREFAQSFHNHREEFKLHVDRQTRIINRGIGAWWAMGLVIMFLLTAGGWYFTHYVIAEQERLARQMEADGNRLTALEAIVNAVRSSQDKSGANSGR